MPYDPSTTETEAVLGDLVEHSGAFDPSSPLRIVRYGYVAERSAVVSFVVPVHNQVTRIRTNLEAARTSSKLQGEFVVVLDDCTDGSAEEVASWAQNLDYSQGSVSGVTIVLTPNGLFETICDSIGIALSSGAYVIEIQADMLIDEVSFDSTMVEVLEAVPSLFLLSGRGAHSLDYPGRRSTRAMLLGKSRSLAYLAYRAVHRRRGWYAASAWELALSNSVGRVGNLIELPAVSLERRWVYLHETVMRGPLAFEKARYEALGGLDADHFFLGDDDHDLAARAWGERSWRSGYTSISFSSPLDAGSTRALRSIVQQSRFDFLNDFYKNAERESYRALRGSNLPKAPRQRIEIL